LNNLIDTSSCLKDIIHYRAKRAAAFFEIKNWNGNVLLLQYQHIICSDALVDIDFIEKYDKIDQSLEIVKWYVDNIFICKFMKKSLSLSDRKSMVHQKMAGIRNDMKAHLDFTRKRIYLFNNFILSSFV
jgi:hypothetical protein